MTISSHIAISVGDDFHFLARTEDRAAPATVAAFRRLLPYTQRLIHCRWIGEGCWVPLGAFHLGVGLENTTSTPAPGELLCYPGGISETELLFPYGKVALACRAGPLGGNHFLTIIDSAAQLRDVGHRVLHHGAHDIRFRLA